MKVKVTPHEFIRLLKAAKEIDESFRGFTKPRGF